MRAYASQAAALHNQVFVSDFLLVKEAFKCLSDPSAVTVLRRERGARDVRSHGVVRHVTPWVVLGWRLWVPHVACVPGLQNAMTSSEARTSAEADGYRIERALMDCVAPPSKARAMQSISVLEEILGC